LINFRYHVVSITSVFLALAVGLVLGTAGLNGAVADDLNDRVSELRKNNQQLRGEVQALETTMEARDAFALQVAPELLAGRLQGRRLLVLTGPGADTAHRDGVVRMLELAGATIAGKAGVNDAFTDPARNQELQDLAAQFNLPGIDGVPNNGNGVETASSLLAKVLLRGGSQANDSNRAQVLAGYGVKFLTVDSRITGTADSVVVVTGPPAAEADADQRNANLATLVRQFDAVVSRTVVAGPFASGEGNLVSTVRDDAELAQAVSTVDTVTSAEGQIATARALAEQIAGGKGHYGNGQGATALMPVPAR